MTTKEFLYALEEIIGADRDSLRGNETLKNLESWDSMATVSFIAMADERFGTLVRPADITTCKTVADLIALFPGKIS